jgi:hypothetical protein
LMAFLSFLSEYVIHIFYREPYPIEVVPSNEWIHPAR